jgi:RNA polymerase sigma factor (sigma-70 family)
MNEFRLNEKEMRKVEWFAGKLKGFYEFEDAKQEMLIKAWKASQTYDEQRGSFTTLLHCVLRDKVKDMLRDYRPEYPVADIYVEDRPIDKINDKILFEQVCNRMDEEVPQSGYIFRKSLEGYRKYEIAALLGVTPARVGQKLKKGKQAIQKVWENDFRN